MFDIKDFKGKPFQWNGNGNPGYDCVSLVVAVLERLHGYVIDYPERGSHNISLPRLPEIMKNHLERYLLPVSTDLYEVGDVFLYQIYKEPCHMGIYVGQQKILTALENKGVTTFSIYDETWLKRLTKVFRWQ